MVIRVFHTDAHLYCTTNWIICMWSVQCVQLIMSSVRRYWLYWIIKMSQAKRSEFVYVTWGGGGGAAEKTYNIEYNPENVGALKLTENRFSNILQKFHPLILSLIYSRCHDELSLNKLSLNVFSGIIKPWILRPQDKSCLTNVSRSWIAYRALVNHNSYSHSLDTCNASKNARPLTSPILT